MTNDIENKIANFMLHLSKFEFFLITFGDNEFALKNCNNKITGVNWIKLGKVVASKYTFSEFDFAERGFEIFKKTTPQFLVKTENRVKWDSEDITVDSWKILFTKGLAQLRNNIAHGNKACPPVSSRARYTEKFIDAAEALIDFVTKDVLKSPNWEKDIFFS